MPILIEFKSTHFQAEPMPTNPIDQTAGGYSVGNWALNALGEIGCSTSSLEPNKWGWYINCSHLDRDYYIEFYQHVENRDQFTIQIRNKRTVVERLLGKARITAEDSVPNGLIAALKSTDLVTEVECE